MDNKLRQAMRRIWEASCQDAPLPSNHLWAVEDGDFVIQLKGARDKWLDFITAAGVPSTASQSIDGDTLTVRWPSHADRLFGVDGILAQHIDGYECREAQLHGARLWQRAIEMRDVAVIEGGTGVGKSFMYAAICMAMGIKFVVSTSNKALQMQLMQKDLPFLNRIIADNRLNIALVQGKSNYACVNRCEQNGEITIDNPEIAQWYAATQSGNFEEISFEVEPRARMDLTVRAAECLGRQCGAYHSCFYYRAKAERQDADVVVCNHALLVLNELYPNAAILPSVQAIVVDEAHQLPQYVRNALGREFAMSKIGRTLDLLNDYATDDDMVKAGRLENAFFQEVTAYLASATDKQVQVHNDTAFESGRTLALALARGANLIWDNADIPMDASERAEQNKANRVRRVADDILGISSTTQPGYVRWLEPQDDIKAVVTPYDASRFIGALAGFDHVEIDKNGTHCEGAYAEERLHTHCARCHRELTAQSVYVLGGQPFGPVCINYVDVLGDAEHVPLADWLAQEHATPEPQDDAPRRADMALPVLFTSATLATPEKRGRNVDRTFARTMQEFGLDDAMQMIAASPFDYQCNALVYIPDANEPNPKDDAEFMLFMVDKIDALVRMAEGGALLLFTSYRNMQHAYDELAWQFEADGLAVYRQGKGLTKGEIIKRFTADGDAVLFATRSFFEGISVEGDALRLVVIDKMPYAAPSPLGHARQEHMRRWAADTLGKTGRDLESYPFFNLTVPEMLTELQQAHGRLIRTHGDRGVVALLDNRARAPWVVGLVRAAMPGQMTHRHYMVEAHLHEDSAKVADMDVMTQFALSGGIAF